MGNYGTINFEAQLVVRSVTRFPRAWLFKRSIMIGLRQNELTGHDIEQ